MFWPLSRRACLGGDPQGRRAAAPGLRAGPGRSYAGSTGSSRSRERRGWGGAGQAQPVHPADRRRQERKPELEANAVNRMFVRTVRRYRTIEIRPVTTSSPPPTLCPTTSMRLSTVSTAIRLRTRCANSGRSLQCWPPTSHNVTGAGAVPAGIRRLWPTAWSWRRRVSR